MDAPVAPGGYAWWYIDVKSDDGRHALSFIAFVGSVFSPYYARGRRRRPTAPPIAEDHSAVNVALYRPEGDRWALTERSRGALHRSKDSLSIGDSSIAWEDEAIVARFSEKCSPFGQPLSGQLRLEPQRWDGRAIALSGDDAHRWWPIAPLARAEVRLDQPALGFSGQAYLDANHGHEPLEAGFRRWSWARLSTADSAVIVYDAHTRDGVRRTLARRYDPSGLVELSPASLRPRALRRTGWGLAQELLVDPGTAVEVERPLEDTPFYARTSLLASVGGVRGSGVQETLSLDRFEKPWVQALLGFRIRRAR